MDVSALSREEQLELLDQLWGEVGHDPRALPLSEAHREELDRRLDELEVDGPIGIPWDDLVARIRAQAR
jgi:putative addiction module component (TIGR02574 family)